MTPRIVVTGMGWITPLGHDLDSVWTRLVNGESGVRPIHRFDASTFPTSFAAEVRDYDFRKYVRDPAMHDGAGGGDAKFAQGGGKDTSKKDEAIAKAKSMILG